MKNISLINRKSIVGVFLFLGITALVIAPTYSENDKFKNNFSWEEIAPIPSSTEDDVQHGLGAPFAGSSNGVILVAGGCNFPDVPVYDGGTKKYYDDIFVYDLTQKDWTVSGKFPYPIAYGASVTTEYGVVCIGGNNINQSLAKVRLMKWNAKENRVDIQPWPDLPFTMANMAAALVGNTIYVAGGKADDKLANKFLSLDLSNVGG